MRLRNLATWFSRACAAFALTGYDSACAAEPPTLSPIKHVVVIVGGSRSFDHVFATYQPGAGEYADNLLSKGIVGLNNAGFNYGLSAQYRATDTRIYSISPTKLDAFDQSGNKLQAPGVSYAFKAPYKDWKQAAWDGPGPLDVKSFPLSALAAIEYGLPQQDLPLLYTGATGINPGDPDSRILNYANLPNGVYPLVDRSGKSLYDNYSGNPVGRFFQMWQQLDCDKSHVSSLHPSGCLADLFPWVEMTVASGVNGGARKPLAEGNAAMGFYNIAQGDAPYLAELARNFTLADNYHQAFMGGGYANFMMLGYADALYYADKNGDPAKPPANMIENPNPRPNTDNWYAQDGYSGGSYVSCSDFSQPGVGAIVRYLQDVSVQANCVKSAYYLVNDLFPAYTGLGEYPPASIAFFTLPPVIKQRHIGDALTQKGVSWAYFGERWNDFKTAPSGAWASKPNPNLAAAYLYCSTCNPFLYSASTMSDPKARAEHNKDLADFYDGVARGDLPAVSYVIPSRFVDGRPASSKLDLFESFAKRIIEFLKTQQELWDSTAIFVTFSGGGGYYDSGYVQPLDFFGDGTRVPLIVVSKYSQGGHVAHEYADHASILKFIERNWSVAPLSNRSRDNLPNPQTGDNPYVPLNRPAIGDLWSMFQFDQSDGAGAGDKSTRNSNKSKKPITGVLMIAATNQADPASTVLCAPFDGSARDAAAAIAQDASAYWDHRRKAVEALNQQRRSLADQELAMAVPLRNKMPMELTRFQSALEALRTGNCRSSTDLIAMEQPPTDLARAVNFDQISSETLPD
ncbi:MAG: alkaline phosphatase family protein [Methylocystis sp.]|uniref:alkaline phosphatase family protein n=1 Tax=Methylocystis sp. TaxID=1911079 RepID=UPI003DA4968C